MQIDIRKSIVKNFHDMDVSEIRKSIEEAVEEMEEVTLPGLGVFFEILWNNSGEDNKNYILNIIKSNI